MSKKSFFLWLIAVIVFGVHLDHLNQQIVRIQTELKTLRGIPSTLFAVESKTAALQNLLLDENFSKGRDIHVFKSPQSVDDVDDALISNAPGQANRNWGGGPRIGAGYDGDGNIYRTLIRFNELKKAIPQEAQIMAVTIYMKQIDNDSKDNQALRERFDLWDVEKNWGEGNKPGSRASQGEATWNAAAEGILKWDLPGCSARSDVNDTLMATTGPNVNGGGNDWVAFSFTPQGIARLEQRLRNKNKSDDGFLIQLEDGFKKKMTFVSFYSSDYQAAPDRPYIELIYMDLSNPAPNGMDQR